MQSARSFGRPIQARFRIVRQTGPKVIIDGEFERGNQPESFQRLGRGREMASRRGERERQASRRGQVAKIGVNHACRVCDQTLRLIAFKSAGFLQSGELGGVAGQTHNSGEAALPFSNQRLFRTAFGAHLASSRPLVDRNRSKYSGNRSDGLDPSRPAVRVRLRPKESQAAQKSEHIERDENLLPERCHPLITAQLPVTVQLAPIRGEDRSEKGGAL
ncbi:hypothetical protein D3C86_1567610 [compost metagenome]